MNKIEKLIIKQKTEKIIPFLFNIQSLIVCVIQSIRLTALWNEWLKMGSLHPFIHDMNFIIELTLIGYEGMAPKWLCVMVEMV